MPVPENLNNSTQKIIEQVMIKRNVSYKEAIVFLLKYAEKG